MCPDFFPGCCSGVHHCSHNASILMCVCNMWPSRIWSTGVGMFHRSLLKSAAQHRYIVSNMCSNPLICPFTFPQAYNATRFKWQNCDNRCKMLGTIYRKMTFGTSMTVCMIAYTTGLPPEWATLYIDLTIWASLTVTCMVSFRLNLSYTPTVIVTSICYTMNASLRVLHFFQRCISGNIGFGAVSTQPCEDCLIWKVAKSG